MRSGASGAPSSERHRVFSAGRAWLWARGNSLVVQWLGPDAFTARVWVQILIGKLRFHKPCNAAKKKEKISQANDDTKEGWKRVVLEKEMATHSSILAWRIPRTQEPGGLQSIGSQRVRHGLVTKHNVKNRLLLGFLKRQL